MTSLGTTNSFPSAGLVTGCDVLTKWWEEYNKRLLRYAYQRVRDRQAAEDAVAEAFFRAQRAINNRECQAMDHEGELRETKFRTWIFRITLNACRDILRQNRTISIDDVVEPAYSSESRQILSLAVREALAQLRPDYAEVVRLCDLDEMSAKEAAQIAGLSVPALKSRLYRGRKHLCDLLSGVVSVRPKTRTSDAARERNGFFTYAECPFSGVEDFAKAHFRANQMLRKVKRNIGRKLRVVFSQNTAGPELRKACHQTIQNMLKQMGRADHAHFWCGLFDQHVPGLTDPIFISAKSNRDAQAELRNGKASLPTTWVVPNAVRPTPPTLPVMHPDTLRLPEPDLSKWNEKPQPIPRQVRSAKPSPVPVKRVIVKPPQKAKQVHRKKKAPLLFIGEKGFVPTVEALVRLLVEKSKGWRDLAEVATELKAARRYPINGEPLSDLTRLAIIDLIYARYPDSDAKALRWVSMMTAQFLPSPDTPEYLLPPPQTKSKPGR